MEEAVAQEEALRMLPLKEYSDVGFSGFTTNRPALRQLLEEVEAGNVAAVVVKDFSRLSRDHLFLAHCRRTLFPQKNTAFLSLGEGYDSRKEGAEEWALLQGLMHQWYGQDVGVKMRALRQKRAQSGQHWGRAPYGYEKTPEGFQISPKEAAVVRQLFLWQKEGLTTGEMAALLNKAQIPTPKKGGRWERAKVRRLLDAPCYEGLLVMGRWEKTVVFSRRLRQRPKESWTVKEGAFPPLNLEKSRHPLERKEEKPPRQKPPHPLKAKVICGGCGKAMVRRWGSYPSFTCPRRAQGEPCPSGTLRQDAVLTAAEELEQMLFAVKYGETKETRLARQAAYAARIGKILSPKPSDFGWIGKVTYLGPKHIRICLQEHWNRWI